MCNKLDNIKWKTRLFCDKVIKEAIQDEIHKLTLAVLGNHKLTIDYSKEGFEPYVYCKSEMKSFCGKHKMHYRGNWREYSVFGNTKTDVYLEVLKCLANENSTYYPIVSFRRDDEWVERGKEEVE